MNRERKGSGSSWETGKNMIKIYYMTESTNMDPWGLSETEPLTKEYTWAGQLHICSRCAVQSLCGSPNNWNGDYP